MNKQEILEYVQSNDLNIQNASGSLFAADLVFESYVNSEKITGVDLSPVLFHCSYKRKGFFYFYQILNLEKIENINHIIYFNYLKNPETLKDKIEEHATLEDKLDKIWQNYKKRGDLNLFKEIINTSRQWWHYGAVGEDKAEVVNKEVVPRFTQRRKIDINYASRIVSVVSHPEKQSPLVAERRIFLNICLDVINKKDTDKKIKSYIKKYFWMNTDFFQEKEITKKGLLEKIKVELSKNSKENILSEIKEIDDNFKKIHKEAKRLENALNFGREDEVDIVFAKLMIKWFDSRKVGMMKDIYYVFSFLRDIARKHNLNYETLSCYTVDEIIKLLETGKKISDSEVKQRHKDSFLCLDKDGLQRFYGKDCNDLLDAVEQKHKNIETIRGAVASIGKEKIINGKVIIILDPLKDSFFDGDILVTSMTRVEFVPLMRKAKAIITDEGGIACHAAIVSRELGIPCIIGTKNATKILKNGDLVEIDTENGTVKILAP